MSQYMSKHYVLPFMSKASLISVVCIEHCICGLQCFYYDFPLHLTTKPPCQKLHKLLVQCLLATLITPVSEGGANSACSKLVKVKLNFFTL